MKLIRIIILLVVTAGTYLDLTAQIPLRVSERKGKTFKLKLPHIQDVHKIPGAGFWSISSGKENYYVSLYDKNMNFKKGNYIYFKFNEKFLDLVEIVEYNGEFLCFLSFTNVKTGKKYMFFTTFDPKKLKTDSEIYKVGELPIAKSKETNPQFKIKVGKGENHILIIGIHPSRKKKKSSLKAGVGNSRNKGFVSTSFWVLDSEKQIVNHKEAHNIEIENAGEEFEFKDYQVGADGTIYILGRNSRIIDLSITERRAQNTVKLKNFVTSAYVLERIGLDGSETQYVTQKGVLYNDMAMLLQNDGNVELIGLRAKEQSSYLVSTAIDRITLDKNGLEVLSETSIAFTENVLDVVNNLREAEQGLSRKRKKQLDKKINKLTEEEQELRKIAKNSALNVNIIAFADLDEKGNPVVVLEERYLQVTLTTNSNGDLTERFYYHYDDLILIRFNEESIYQRAYSKSFTSLNYSLTNPISVTLTDQYVTVVAQEQVLRSNNDLSELRDYKLKGNEPTKTKVISAIHVHGFIFKKYISGNLVLGAHQVKNKTTWIKINIK